VQALPGAGGDDARRVLVDEFFRAVEYGERGFPIREEGQLAVATLDAGGGSLSLAGDFNGWDATALPLAQPVGGFPFYYRITPVSEPLPRTLYKLVRNGTDYFADPRARRFGYDQFGELSLAAAGTAQSHLERWPAFDRAVGALAPRDLVVYVPAGTATGLPVLYLQDGQNLFDPDAMWGGWHAGETADALIAGGQVRPFLAVGIYNTAARMDEYTHVPDDLGGGTVVGGRADEYVDFLVDGVKPFIEARYPVATGKAATGVLGSSLGGLVSCYAAYRAPTAFGFVGSMSGSFFWGETLGNDTMMQLYAAGAPAGVSVYLDSGGTGSCPGSGDNYCETVEMADTLRGLGWTDGVDLHYAYAPGAQHNEAAWAARLPGALTAWFPGP